MPPGKPWRRARHVVGLVTAIALGGRRRTPSVVPVKTQSQRETVTLPRGIPFKEFRVTLNNPPRSWPTA